MSQRRTPRKSVAYAKISSYDAYIIQNNKTFIENLLLYIFKHEISRKKIIRGKQENICTRKMSNVRSIISIFDIYILIAFEYALIANESF